MTRGNRIQKEENKKIGQAGEAHAQTISFFELSRWRINKMATLLKIRFGRRRKRRDGLK